MTTRTKPRRRWFQFSLRTLLLLVALLCVWLALLVNSARKQRAAVAAIEALGGWVVCEYETHWSLQEPPQEPPGSKWLRELVGEEYFFTISEVGLHTTQITDAGLEHLKGLKSLQYLDLGSTYITDAGLEHLKGLKSLQYLNLGSTNVTDAGLEHLEGLKSLRILYLYRTKVTDAGLEHLTGLTNLEHLNLVGINVTDKGVKKLQKALPNCKIYHP